MDKVAYIIKTRKGEFRGFIALLTPDADDSALFVLHSTNKFTDLEQAREELKKLPSDIKPFMNPIDSSEDGLSWLSELKKANQVI